MRFLKKIIAIVLAAFLLIIVVRVGIKSHVTSLINKSKSLSERIDTTVKDAEEQRTAAQAEFTKIRERFDAVFRRINLHNACGGPWDFQKHSNSDQRQLESDLPLLKMARKELEKTMKLGISERKAKFLPLLDEYKREQNDLGDRSHSVAFRYLRSLFGATSTADTLLQATLQLNDARLFHLTIVVPEDEKAFPLGTFDAYVSQAEGLVQRCGKLLNQ